jgi:hypothetical protein
MPTQLQPHAAATPEEALLALNRAMDGALENADAERFGRLARERHALLQQLCAPGPLSAATRALLEQLIQGNRRWVEALCAHRDRAQADIERLGARRNGRRTLRRSYGYVAPGSRCGARHG